MAAWNQGDGSSLHQPDSRDTASRDAVLSRLADRHAHLKAAQLRRVQQSNQQSHIQGPGRATSEQTAREFLPRFLHTKAEILSDLDTACTTLSEGSLSASELTQLLDDTLHRVEELQKSLNEASLYLTPFDLEQARLELKSLNTQFQAKREHLLPTKKFSFTRKPKSSSIVSEQQSNPVAEEDKQTGREHHSTTDSLSIFDPAFSLVNIHGPQTLYIPKNRNVDANAELAGQSVYLEDLKDCIIHVVGVCGNLIARRLIRCRLYTCPVAGSVWIEQCEDCDFVVACRQLRVHQTQNCRLGLHMASRPIIEHSTALLVAPYPFKHAELPTQLTMAGLTEDVNRWQEVDDFSHPNKRLTTGSPNWCILPESEWNTLAP